MNILIIVPNIEDSALLQRTLYIKILIITLALAPIIRPTLSSLLVSPSTRRAQPHGLPGRPSVVRKVAAGATVGPRRALSVPGSGRPDLQPSAEKAELRRDQRRPPLCAPGGQPSDRRGGVRDDADGACMRAAPDRRPARGDATDDERTWVLDAPAEQPQRARRVRARGSTAGELQGREGGDVPAAVVVTYNFTVQLQ